MKASSSPFVREWQRDLVRRMTEAWEETRLEHRDSIDDFGRSIQARELLGKSTSISFDDFTSYVALRLSREHWTIGQSQKTRGGTGDHIRKQRTISPGYRAFITAIKAARPSELSVVTTNYDLVIEKLLGPRESGRLGGFNYGVVGERLIGTHALSSKWSYGSVETKGRVPLYKLHGSLNFSLSDEGLLQKYIDSRPARAQRRGWDRTRYRPVIVPPGGVPEFDALGPIWNGARLALQRADMWLVCGYSVPENDAHVRRLLQESAVSLRSILVLDPMAERVEEALIPLVGEDVRIKRGPALTDAFEAKTLKSLMT